MSSKEAAGPTSPAFLFWCHPELVRRRRRREGPYAAFVSSRTQAGLCSALAPDDPASPGILVFGRNPRFPPFWCHPELVRRRRRREGPYAAFASSRTQAGSTLSFRPQQITAGGGLRSGEPAAKCLRRLTARTFPLKPRSGLTNHLHAILSRAEFCA